MSSFQLQNAEVLARLKPFGILFEKSLSDLIKGIRSYSKESAESLLAFLDSAIMECKNELSTTDLETKAMAILKLTYLEMYGFEMSWCNFQILEVMSSSKFQQKRIGYLAAIQSFKNEQDLLILATNQFKKDLNSHNHIEIGLALSGIATIVTPNLSKDINDDVLIKLNHSKPYIRKKAVLAMYKIFLQYPDSLRMNFNRIIDKLDDSDISVVSATINVICEISKKNPNVFVTYLPKFFTILEGTKNNWLIIRILKLFQSLSKVEQRMKKKILPTIMELMLKTQASSLIYECINCIVNGSMLYPDSSKDKETAKTCIEQIMNFFETRDSNLKFVGLLALINILQVFPDLMHRVKGVSQVIMDCLTDDDLIIKRKALEVSSSLVTEDNITELVKVLLVQLIPSETTSIPETLKLEITMRILSVSSKDNYSNIPNFKWYIAVLKDMINLTLLPLSSINNATISQSISNSIASAIGKEFKILATRVPSIRSAILNKVISDAVQDIRILENCPLLLRDFYWIMGEYIDEFRITSDESDDDDDDDDNNDTSRLDIGKLIQIFNTLVNHKIDIKLNLVTSLNFPISATLLKLQQSEVLVVLIQALIKLYNGIVTGYNSGVTAGGSITQENYKQLSYFLYKLINFLENWEYHSNYEVQERALSWLEFLKICLEAMLKDNYAAIEKLESEEVEYYKQLALAVKEVDSENESLSDSDNDDDEENSDEEDSDEEDSDEEDSDEEDSDEEDSNEEDSNKEDSNEEGNEENSLKAGVKITSNKGGNLLSLDGEKEDVNAIDLNGAVFDSSSIANALSSKEEYSYNSPEPSNDQLPMLLTHVLPSFFKSYPLNPISSNSQRKIQIPQNLNLDNQINLPPFDKLSEEEDNDEDSYSMFLSDDSSINESDYPLITLSNEGSQEDLRKKQERIDRLKDDPYYITSTKNKKSKSKSASKSNKLLVADDEKQSSPDFNEISSIHSSQQLKSKKPKSKKVKKERVVILSEETIEGSNNNEPESDVVQPPKPRKKNVLNIDSSKLANFDINSSSISDTLSVIESNNKPYEYDIDLDDLRSKLAESSLSKKPMNSKKKKTKKKEKDDGENKLTDKGSSNVVKSAVPPQEPISITEDNIVSVKKPKKKKKKTKAIILEK